MSPIARMLLLAALLLAGCGPAPSRARLSTAQPQYATPLPYAVMNLTTTAAASDGAGQVPVTLWYPAPDSSGGPFPVIVFSPGAQSVASAYDALLAYLAGHGFVVVTWDPRKETEGLTWQKIAARPADRRAALDEAQRLAAPGQPLAGVADFTRLIEFGFSLGSWTSLMAAGAQMGFGWCAENPGLIGQDMEPTCTLLLERQDKLAARLDAKPIPGELWPAARDPRVQAVVIVSPVGKIWGAGYAGLAGVRAPALVVVGGQDTIIRPETGGLAIYDHLASPDKTLQVYNSAAHDFIFLPPAENADFYRLVVEFLVDKMGGG